MQTLTTGHPGDNNWRQAMLQIAAAIQQHGVHAHNCVVLLPYVQLIPLAKNAWLACAADMGLQAAFLPRFETTLNWAAALSAPHGGFVPSADDIRLDAAIDVLTAAALLARAGLASQQHALAGQLVEAASALARLAAAQPPQDRLDWGVRLAAEMAAGMESPTLAFELAVARIALAWTASSAYATDILFEAEADLLVIVEGFQSEPLAEALKTRFEGRTHSFALTAPELPGTLALHPTQDAEDEAQRAAACVMAHLAAGHGPVALIAQDRVLTRRIRAMLDGRGVVLRDETGWKLSTTRAAATLMSLLRMLPWDASADAVLDWLKNAPAFDVAAVNRLEAELRQAGVRFWRSLPKNLPAIDVISSQVNPLRDSLQKPRVLSEWLTDLREVLQSTGLWTLFLRDIAGQALVEALFLTEGSVLLLPATARMSLQDFSNWANQVLEAASFSPEHPPQAQVVILPLSQLLGRPLQAVVLPAADEVRLSVSPEPPGIWTPAQRELLGLPSRTTLAAAQRTAWLYALHMPFVDVLWRTSEAGERLMPSGFVQEVMLQQSPTMAADPRGHRSLVLKPTLPPQPTGQLLPLARLSASAYEDLRRCPYRFFALRQLGLQDAGELESELGKREFGNWLHTLLHRFHLALNAAPVQDLRARLAMINIASEEAAAELGLGSSEFLPFAAIWPRVRDGYLQWLAAHEASGAQFVEGESWKEMPLGKLLLVGKIDRMDKLADGSQLVMDYKTEARSTTQQRISDAQEDTQLAFYAALLHDDTLAAAYVNLGEKETTKTYLQDDIVSLRDQLIESILNDMNRIANAAPLPALGEGKACEYCAARGLCRKDFWEAA